MTRSNVYNPVYTLTGEEAAVLGNRVGVWVYQYVSALLTCGLLFAAPVTFLCRKRTNTDARGTGKVDVRKTQIQ